MAQLLDLSTHQVHPVRAHHTIGRNVDTVDTPIGNSLASRLHAVLEWNGASWLVKDISRNGTWLDGKRLSSKESTPISRGQQLRFGGEEAPQWQFVDDSPPVSLLVGTGASIESIELRPYLFLPNEASPELVITYSPENSCWIYQDLTAESFDQLEEIALQHNATVSCGAQQWHVFLCETGSTTEIQAPPREGLQGFEFVFDLSLDEENTHLQLVKQDQTVDLGERSHHYLLLHLARKRAIEAGDGLDPRSQGWIATEQLSKDLGVDMAHINILIYRARKQLEREVEQMLESAPLVERGRGRVRFGCPRFKIYKGQDLAFQLPLADRAQ